MGFEVCHTGLEPQTHRRGATQPATHTCGPRLAKDVQQLLHLGRLGEQFDAILDDPLLNLSPGHRVAVNGWLRKEAASAKRTLP